MSQPLPQPNDHAGIQKMVISDLYDRMASGIATYGTELQPFNGRDAIQDLYEELLDAACYVRQVLVEHDDVLEAVSDEMNRQHTLWGQQNHPDTDPNANYGIPPADIARQLCEDAFENGVGTWAHIFVEEVAEALDTNGDEVALREELVQVAAVAAQWVKAIDRRHETS